MYKHLRQVKKYGYTQYPGSAEQICKAVVDNCWNGRFFQTSAGHYNEFYSRDLGWCTDALVQLGYTKQLKKTLVYALEKFKKSGITVAITPQGKPFNFPNYYSIDSVAYFFRSVNKINPSLFEHHHDFFQQQLNKLFTVINPDTGLVRDDAYFSSMRDHTLRKSSCYDNTMIAMLAEELKTIQIDHQFDYNFKKIVKETFWTGNYFVNDSEKTNVVTGDSNIYPFWFNLFPQSMLKKAMKAIEQAKLDRPFPLKYVHKPIKEQKMIFVEMFVKDWEQDTIWPQMGLVYIDLMRRINKPKAKEQLREYTKRIEQHKNFLELYDKRGNPYKTRWYYCDESMLWASMYLALRNLT